MPVNDTQLVDELLRMWREAYSDRMTDLLPPDVNWFSEVSKTISSIKPQTTIQYEPVTDGLP